MLTWILECEGLNPGFLIGGVPFGFEGLRDWGRGRLSLKQMSTIRPFSTSDQSSFITSLKPWL